MLEIQHLTKIYPGGKKAVDDLSLNVRAGEICGFIGAKGAGKTSTIKAVVGIHGFEQGEILIHGKSIRTHPLECKRQMAYIPDNPDLYEHLTGYQYINFIADIYRVSSEERRKRVERYGELFEMTSSLGNVITSYSHGMKQRTAIIAALVLEVAERLCSRIAMIKGGRLVVAGDTDRVKGNHSLESVFMEVQEHE